MIGVTLAHLLSHFIRAGVQWIASAAWIGGEIERAFFTLTRFKPRHHSSKHGIPETVLTGQAQLRAVA
jgi:hypothetical protein